MSHRIVPAQVLVLHMPEEISLQLGRRKIALNAAASMPLPLTMPERSALGHRQRKHMRRADHAGWVATHRSESPLKLIEHSVRGRVPHLLSLKNQRMSASPFAYFRGAAPVMAYDLSLGPNTGIHTQLCGDAHVLNLGAFEGIEGNLLFDINDFDETIPGPFEWDVKRMATSLILAGLDAGEKHANCHEATAVFLESYRLSILRFRHMPVIKLARYQVHRLSEIDTMSGIFAIAQRSTPMHNLLALTEPASSKQESVAKVKPQKVKHSADPKSAAEIYEQPRIFQQDPPILTRISGAAAQPIIDSLTIYARSLHPERRHFLAQYQTIDVAFKVVGIGSVGLRDYCIYMQGNGAKDPLFLQIKEETASAYQPYLGKTRTAKHQGQRVVEGERAMQLQSDPFLGWTSIEGRDYLVRQLNDHKASVDVAGLKDAALMDYAQVCGEMLARGHARAGDPAVLAGYIGPSSRFDQAVTKFAITYAEQTETDWKHFTRAMANSHQKTKTSPKKMPKKAKF